MRYSRFNSNAGAEYMNDVEAIKQIIEEADDPERVAADAFADHLEEQFANHRHGELTKSGGSPCIGRLIEGWGQCKHGWHNASHDEAPHSPPHSDHVDLWLLDGEPYAYTMHLYDLGHRELIDITEFAEANGLRVEIDPASWHYMTETTCVVFTNPSAVNSGDGR